MANMEINKDVFIEEAMELLHELETSLIELEEQPDDAELISRIFRAMHTIKGSGGMYGYDNISSFTHDIETAFDQVRSGKVPVTKELIDVTLKARDQIRKMLDEEGAASKEDGEARAKILAELRRIVPVAGAKQQQAVAQSAPPSDVPKEEDVTYRIRFKPSREIFLRGIDPLLLIDEVRTLGQATVMAMVDEIAFLDEIDPEQCYTFWDIILTTNKGVDAIKDVFIFVQDDAEIAINAIFRPGEAEEGEGPKRIGDILIERGDVSGAAVKKITEAKKLLGEQLVEAGLVTHGEVASALAEQQHIKALQEKRQVKEGSGSIRVASEKLDLLVNLIGELVTMQAHLTQTAAASNDAKLTSIAEAVERLTSELRDTAMVMRMVTIDTTFAKFKRLVRDLSTELGKEIDLATEGGETELDKTVIEKLNDPLVHLMRNSIDHGIETPDIREAAGKKRIGTIRLCAVHAGSAVLIKIQDDGAGLDTAVIRAKAVEKGIITADAVMSDKEIFGLIMAPGFTTAKKVTNVSGRGVGMDVVRQAIDALRGTIDIESVKGKGSTITLKLPLTLAIIDGLLVKVGGESFVLPLSSVKECVELTQEGRKNAHGRNLANVRNQIVPYIRLREQFFVSGALPEREQIVITEVEDGKVGFVVDSVVGQHQTVLKSLGSMYRDIEGLSGATILGDGSVALILDIVKLARMSTIAEANSVAGIS
jgi:two-component system chemotaxis sensor kinase CheA